ncbi:DUF4876 domain-containing protein [Prolixibacteraceae bacterium Z1-6]|uniref:DUF4876 domain-containing protein n=1 Tax=Draconibacterium aestuarii TaxID=2998507 RepID=A0A9X3J4S2_9BACT|nr:DUF4876 domain-containing protein [Prolixibacteraceae bacterium Z1-6]
MTKLITILFFFFLLACTQYDVPSAYTVEVQVTYPETINNGGFIANANVNIEDKQTGRTYTATTNSSGQAFFELRGGNYDITVSTSEEHEIEIDGYTTRKTLLINGALTNQIVDEANIQLKLQTSFSIVNEGFVIKELYVSGSRTPEGKNYNADAFVEIYNNSDKVLYSDGLCFGTVHPITTFRPSPWVDSEGNLLDRIPCWAFVAIVPGSGTDYPIQPGKSFVIALNGINHRDDPNGNPNSIDLSNADWEFCVEDNGYYVDAPGVPNILMQKVSLMGVRAMVLSLKGQVSILFRLPSTNIGEEFTNPDNFMIQPGGSERCFMVPYSWVIDGVENVQLNDLGVYKRLPTSIDLGYIQHRGSGEKVSIRRKVKEVINGRVVYMDTNNSTEDFSTNQDPQPGVISAY